MKTQLRAPKGPFLGHFFPFTVSSWHNIFFLYKEAMFISDLEWASLPGGVEVVAQVGGAETGEPTPAPVLTDIPRLAGWCRPQRVI